MHVRISTTCRASHTAASRRFRGRELHLKGAGACPDIGKVRPTRRRRRHLVRLEDRVCRTRSALGAFLLPFAGYVSDTL